MLWKLDGSKLKSVPETTFTDQNVLESQLEEWIKENPQILGENLLIVGQQIQIEDVKDKLDLLAIGENWDAVIIELKRGTARGDTDIQSLKYASYISTWDFEDIQKKAEEYFKQNHKDQSFVNALDELREDENLDYEDVNGNQRIIIVGTEINEKIRSVARWLIDKDVKIKLVRITPYTDNNVMYLKSEIILPQPEIGIMGKPSIKGKPWTEDGKTWHLEKRCNEKNAQRLMQLRDIILNIGNVTESWDQEFYVAFIVSDRNWVGVNTYPNQLNSKIKCEKGKFNKTELSSMLNIPTDLIEIEEKGTHDNVIIKIRENFTFEREEFKNFLKECYESFLKIV